MEYAAVIKLRNEWIGTKTYLFWGESPAEVILEMEQRQDLPFFISQCQDFETEKRGRLDELDAFYAKYASGALTVEDIAALDFDMKVGQICCLAAAQGENAVATLAQYYPNAISIR